MRNRRRLIELGKDIVIALLTLSALALLMETPLIRDSGVLDLLGPKESPGVGLSAVQRGTAMLPARLAVTGAEGRFGAQYDEAALEENFSPLAALLGDALASAGEVSPITEADFLGYLGRENIYFDFLGRVPLAALERWLRGGGGGTLTGGARRAALCAGTGDQVLLCWQEGEGAYFSCPTALTRSLHLDPAVAAATPNGAYFAFERGEMTALLDPCTLITEEGADGAQYAASNPLADGANVAAVLEALGYSAQNHAPVSGGEVYLDGGDRLVAGKDGTVVYRAARPGKYPASAGEAGGVEAARALAESALGPLCGEARLYVISADQEQGALRVRFGYLLSGCAVQLGDEGWAAEFLVQDGYITQFTLRFRSFAANGEHTLLLPIDKAAAMLPDVTQRRRELVIQYRDAGDGPVRPEWVAA